jgi:cytochrome b561
MERYHPILVVIHWVMLVSIVMAWTSGQFVLEHTPNSDPGKIDALRMHMPVGLIAGAHEFGAAILFLLVIGHVVAALYHQYWLKDGLFSRMWFGKRS